MMWARFVAWMRRPALTPDVIAVPHSALADRLDAVDLLCRSALDEQARHWPEDRDQQLIDLAADVLTVLGDRPASVPVVPGDDGWEGPR